MFISDLWHRYWVWANSINEHKHQFKKVHCFPGHTVKVCGCGALRGSKNGIIIYRLWEKLEKNEQSFRNHLQNVQKPVYKDPPNYCKPL